MKYKYTNKWWCGALLTSFIGVAFAAETAPGILGKNEWLFYRYELSELSDSSRTAESVSLIQRFNKVLATQGINLAVTMVPLKMRIYAEHLPDDIKLNDYTVGNFERMNKALQTGNVSTIDLNTAFLGSTKRNGDSPFFFRLDTHWTPSGAMLAAETIRLGIEANPTLKKAFDTTPPEGFKISVGNRKRPAKARDLVEQLPPNALTFAPEMMAAVNVSRTQPLKEDLFGKRAPIGLTLLGSSYSHEWTGFADALRFVLQRDVLSISVGADKGSWVGMESYLRDDAFQTQAPKILIWEMPERDMRAPPDYKFRDARYVSSNTEWLLRASAWVQASCKPSTVKAKIVSTGLAANAANLKGADVITGPTNDAEFIEISFDKPIDNLDYLMARATTVGSKSMVLEGSGPGAVTRRFTMEVAGDDAAHALKSPLPSTGIGFTKLRIFPGTNSSFALQGLQLCRQPEDLLL